MFQCAEAPVKKLGALSFQHFMDTAIAIDLIGTSQHRKRHQF
jgi:hypothetical protein